VCRDNIAQKTEDKKNEKKMRIPLEVQGERYLEHNDILERQKK
jgi:hypothetical protein